MILLRHGPTAWNETGRIQGRADPPLSAAGRRWAHTLPVPHAWHAGLWHSSPLRRARETATLLGAASAFPDAGLREMAWGAWEGTRLADLRRAAPQAMAANEAQGLDFRPPGGESPREVAARLRAWLNDLGDGPLHLAVTHRGVIRAALIVALGWEMHSKPPCKLARFDGLALTLEANGAICAVAPVPLPQPEFNPA